jgi:hypothetical protein
MLINLKTLDVDIGENVSRGCGYHHRTHPCLQRHVPSERDRRDNDGAGTGDRGEQDDQVTVDAMEEYDLVSNGGDELEDHLWKKKPLARLVGESRPCTRLTKRAAGKMQ